jgi:5-bromo-4-chloroindolyl phosphate hydrolysis protein
MIHIKRFFDRVSLMESKKSKDFVLPMSEARVLKDEIAKLLADLHQLNAEDKNKDEVIKVEITGGSFK